MKRKVLPPTYFLGSMVAMVGLHFAAPLYRYWTFPVALLGVVPLAVGILLNVTADRQFHRNATTVKPFERSSALVTSFPFSISRNPMYVGVTLMLLGVAMLLGTASSLIPVLAFPVLMDRRFVRAEEAMLADAFGAEWREYSVSVRKWI